MLNGMTLPPDLTPRSVPRCRGALASCLLAAAAASGCASHPAQTSLAAMPLIASGIEQGAPTPGTAQARYQISLGDEIEVRYLQLPEYNTSVTVAPDGTVVLPYLDSVAAAGRTVDELRSALEDGYAALLASAPDPAGKRYLININDQLEISFPYNPEYNTRATVRPDGRISLPLVASVIAEGRSPEEVEAELQTHYARHFADPVLAVSLARASSTAVMHDGRRRRVPLAGMTDLYVRLRSAQTPKIFVGGEVRNPSALAYSPMLTSLQAILSAGGVVKGGDLDKVVILRKGSGGTPLYMVKDLGADIRGAQPAAANAQRPGMDDVVVTAEPTDTRVLTNDTVLQPFDVVIVPKSTIARVRDVLDQYLFDLLPPLRNASVGFSYVKPVGTQDVRQTNITEP